MSGASSGFDRLRSVDSVDEQGVHGIQEGDQSPDLVEQQSIEGAALQQRLGAEALTDNTLPPPRARAQNEYKTATDDGPARAAVHSAGRAAIRNGDNADANDGSDDLDDEKEDDEFYNYDEQKDFTPQADIPELPLDPVGLYRATALEGTKAETLKAEAEVALAKDIEAGLFADQLLKVLDGTEDLSRMNEEEAARLVATAQRYSGRREELVEMMEVGKTAKSDFVGHNLRLAYKLAMQKAYTVSGRSEPMDWVTWANDGVFRAVEKFDYTKGYKFSTYATPWIRQYMDLGWEYEERSVRLPSGVEEKIGRVSRVERDLRSRLQPGEEVTAEAIAAEIGGDMTAERVEQLKSYNRRALSLDQTIPGSDNDTEYTDTVVIEDQTDKDASDDRHPDPVARAALARIEVGERDEIEDELRDLLGGEEGLFDTIVLRFGLLGNEPHTQAEVAQRFGVGIKDARRWEKHALAILQDEENRRLFERFR